MIVRVKTEGEVVLVRFVFDREVEAKKVNLTGDFNGWDEDSLPMEHRDDGHWHLEMTLKPGDYQFKYLVDGIYYNDDLADKYVPNFWGSEDSVVSL